MDLALPPAMLPTIDDSHMLKLHEVIKKGSLDFDGWVSLISEIEKSYPDDIEIICLAFNAFLSKFPLCHVYWTKYAFHKGRLSTLDKTVEVFEQAVESAMCSVQLWVEYCSFGILAYEDPSHIRGFKKLVALMEEQLALQNCDFEVEPETVLKAPNNDEVFRVIEDLKQQSAGPFRSKAVKKFLYIGEWFYQRACNLEAKIINFETRLERHFFDVKPLDIGELENWHQYLDFIEIQDDFEWAVKLYERCLIPCANYPEFWMRYVDFSETKGGRELAKFALERATQIILKDVPVIHLFNSRFKEKIGDVSGARHALALCDRRSDFNFIESVVKKANMEKRLGNYVAASNVYIKALEAAEVKQKLHALPILYVHFSQLEYMITGSVDASRDILIDGIQRLPGCKALIEKLMNFLMMHGGAKHVNVVDSVVTNAISPKPDSFQGLSAKEREDTSNLYLEFVDHCGTICDVRKAWNRHIKLFPDLIRNAWYKHHDSDDQLSSMAVDDERRDNLVAATPPHPSDDDETILAIDPNDQNSTERPESEEVNNNLQLSPDISKRHDESDHDVSIQTSPGHSKTNELQQDQDHHDFEQNPKPVSAGEQSKNSQENASHDHEAQENSASNRSAHDPISTQVVDSSQIHIESPHPDPSALENHQNSRPMDQTNKILEDSGVGSGVHSQEQQHQQWQVSQQQQYPPAATQENPTAPAWPMQTAATAQQPSHLVAYLQAQTSPYSMPMQSNEYQGQTQSIEAYNQMWQYYYYQQQQQQQQQQQLIQQQQQQYSSQQQLQQQQQLMQQQQQQYEQQVQQYYLQQQQLQAQQQPHQEQPSYQQQQEYMQQYQQLQQQQPDQQQELQQQLFYLQQQQQQQQQQQLQAQIQQPQQQLQQWQQHEQATQQQQQPEYSPQQQQVL